MDIFGACMLFLSLILIYLAIAEIFTVLFRFTGLPAEKARFQVVSLLTGSGFTTRESELVVSTRTRRKLARVTMLFGYVFNITIVSAFVNVFLSLKETQLVNILWGMPVPAAVFAAVLLLRRNAAVRAWENRMVERIAGRLSGTAGKNVLMLLDYIGGNAMAQVSLSRLPARFADVPLSDAGLRNEGILVMLLERGGREPAPPAADTVFLEGDRLVVFGPLSAVRSALEAEEPVAEAAGGEGE